MSEFKTSSLEHRLDILSLEQCNQERIRLRAENERLRKDAERLQWVLQNFTRIGSLDMSGNHSYTGIGRTIGRGINIRAAIDAAMQETGEPK